MNHRSLAFRLAVWYALLLSAIFALVGSGMLFGFGQYLRSSLGDSLQRRSTQVQQILEQAPASVSNAAIAEAINLRVAPEFNNRFVRVTRLPASLVYRSGAPADGSFDPLAVPPLAARSAAFRATVQGGSAGHIQRLVLSATPVATASGRYLIELGSSLDSIAALQERLMRLLGILLPVLIICAAAAGYWLVNWTLRPVDRLSQTAAQMSVQNLEARLPVVPSGDALQRLSMALNHLLARLRDSVLSSRRFLADASHELRTPLTVIKGELQEIIENPKVPSELRDRIGSVLEEVARLEHLVAGLLALSRLDAGEAKRQWVEVDLAALATSTADQMRLLAEDRGVRLQAPERPPMFVRGDPARLKQVIVNLLDNAIRCTPRGGSVTLQSVAAEDCTVLEVRDTGTGIPSTALPYVFDRFFRVDAARSREDGGAGLGLAIVKSICVAHGAEIEVDTALGKGSCFRLKFPSVDAATALPVDVRVLSA